MRLTRTKAIQLISQHKVLTSSILQLHQQILEYVYWPDDVAIEDEIVQSCGLVFPSSYCKKLSQLNSYEFFEELHIQDILAQESWVRSVYIFAFMANYQLLQNASNNYLAYKANRIVSNKTLIEILPEPEPVLHTCACCGYSSLVRLFDICPVCLWEEDGHRNLDIKSSSNKGISLRQARANFEMYRVMSEQCFVPDLDRALQYQRLPNWEALRDIYCTVYDDDLDIYQAFNSLPQEQQSLHLANHVILMMDAQTIKNYIAKKSDETLWANNHLMPALSLISFAETNASSDLIHPAHYFLLQNQLFEKVNLLENTKKQLILNSVFNTLEIVNDLIDC